MPSLTLKLIVDGCHATPSVLSSRSKVRVVAVVEHDEARVDVVGLVRCVDPDRVRVAAGVGAGLEHRDVMPVVQQVRHHQPGDAGADDCDPHRALPVRSLPMYMFASEVQVDHL
jgi:hypothetical protein